MKYILPLILLVVTCLPGTLFAKNPSPKFHKVYVINKFGLYLAQCPRPDYIDSEWMERETKALAKAQRVKSLTLIWQNRRLPASNGG